MPSSLQALRDAVAQHPGDDAFAPAFSCAQWAVPLARRMHRQPGRAAVT